MILYAVQWHSAPLPPHADENDLDWTTWTGHDDYVDERDADEVAREFDAAFDGAYVHRVVARRVEGPAVVRAGAVEAAEVRGSEGPALATSCPVNVSFRRASLRQTHTGAGTRAPFAQDDRRPNVARMADDLKNRGAADRTRINVHEAHELRYWTETLKVSKEQLIQAVEKVGVMAKDVRQHLGK